MHAGHRALDRILPEEYLAMWDRLGELQKAQEEKEEARAVRKQKQQEKESKQKKRELKDSLSGHAVSMHTDRIEELLRIINSDKLTSEAMPSEATVALAADVHKSLTNLGCSAQHIHDVTLGLRKGAAHHFSVHNSSCSLFCSRVYCGAANQSSSEQASYELCNIHESVAIRSTNWDIAS